VRGFDLENNGLLTSALFLPAGREEEREKNEGNTRMRPLVPSFHFLG
jgi:hypothetical protein